MEISIKKLYTAHYTYILLTTVYKLNILFMCIIKVLALQMCKKTKILARLINILYFQIVWRNR